MIVPALSFALSLALPSPIAAQGQAPYVRPSGVPVGDFELPRPARHVPMLRVDLPKVSGEEGAGDHEMWKPVCTQSQTVTMADLERMRLVHQTLMQRYTVVDTTPASRIHSGTGLNVIFNAAPSVPAAALAALVRVERYIESQFRDPMRITINISFQNLGGGGVLGATSSNFRSILYDNAQPRMISNMDWNDTLQTFLPPPPTLPVRYNQTATITDETRVFFTFANWRALEGVINSSNPDGSMTINTQFNFDYNPADGIASNRYSFVDIIIHEVGHAMGFTSGVDGRTSDLEAMDLFRFQRTDATPEYNPDDTAEFTTFPRLVDFDAPNDDHITDLISVEYRMADGSPYQASHFREQPANIGLMDPAVAARQTFYPDYYSVADAAVFDLIGYDR